MAHGVYTYNPPFTYLPASLYLLEISFEDYTQFSLSLAWIPGEPIQLHGE